LPVSCPRVAQIHLTHHFKAQLSLPGDFTTQMEFFQISQS
jgi:hypothetical protein